MSARCLTAGAAVTLAVVILLPAPQSIPAANALSFRRIRETTAEDLERQLADVPVVGLGDSAQLVLAAYDARMRQEAGQQISHALVDALPLLELRPDLRTLPLRRDDDCKLSARAATALESLSRKLRADLDKQAPIDRTGERPELPRLRAALHAGPSGHKPEWLQPEAIPTLLQLLCHEDKAVRLMLIDLLDGIPGKASTVALTRRAVFDLDPEVRESAVSALRGRPLPTSRRVFIELLRYPWGPPAEHAAEALVNLADRGAIGQLVATLSEPEPRMPTADGKSGSVVRELVRIHHLTNCILCHPPAATGVDPVLGADPVLQVNYTSAEMARAVQRLLTTPGSHSYGSDGHKAPALLRADVTYLRQDFSILQPVPPAAIASLRSRAGPLGARTQRFDFVVRKRPVSKKESDKFRTANGAADSPQRAATLFALRELTGRDAGKSYADWLKLYPDAADEAEAARLSVALIQARGDHRDMLLAQYRDDKGVVYTLALAAAIASLDGKFQEEAREALTLRLTRMKTTTLRERLREEEPELRRAAVAALARKQDESVVPDLIGALDDNDRGVADAAGAALRQLSGKSYSNPRDWREWWRKGGSPGGG